ncbi:MAG: FAD-binding oxidoreductase [Myxococcota bacterium]|jgi:glycine/D-amino acid oxidase-like deaminating enzyme
MTSTQSKQVDVAIVGGGIIGCAIAWYLNRRGLSVGVYEKGRIAGEQSGKNSGFVRKQGRDRREMPLIKRSLDLWGRIDAEIGGITGFTASGNLALASDEAKLEGMNAWLAIAREFNVDSRVASPAELKDISPSLRTSFLGGLHTPSDGRAEPSLAAPAIAHALTRAGMDVRENCLVEGLLLEAGKVVGIATERGEVRARTVVVAAGLWSGIFLRRYGISLPQVDLRVSVGRTAPFAHGVALPTIFDKALVRPRYDGGLTIAPGLQGPLDYDTAFRSLRHAPRYIRTLFASREGTRVNIGKHLRDDHRMVKAYLSGTSSRYADLRVPNVPANDAVLARSRAAARAAFGIGDDMKLVETWACRIDITPDGVPVLDQVNDLGNLVIATGMSGHGFGISLGVGDTLAELIDTGRTTISLEPFRLSRFSERYFAAPQNVL